MKLLKQILFLVFLVLIILISILTISGYSMYKTAIDETSLSDRISNIESDSNYSYYEDLPDDYVCPLCGVGKDMFEKQQ